MPVRYLTLLFAVVLVVVAAKGLREVRLAGRQSRQQAALPLPPRRNHRQAGLECPLRHPPVADGGGGRHAVRPAGVGGGFVIVPALQHFSDLAMRSIVATSLAVIALISLSGVAATIHSGQFDLALGLPFATGASAGMLLGGRLASRWPPASLKLAFSLICLAVACGLIGKTLL
jgi:uncharacterized membrane protein YfcA